MAWMRQGPWQPLVGAVWPRPAALQPLPVALQPPRSFNERSSWILGSYAPALSEKHHLFLRLLKNQGFKDESRTKVGLYAIGTSTTLESNKSQIVNSIPLQRHLYLT